MITRDYAALTAFLGSRMRAPFAWGAHDCVTFAAGAVLAQTGQDPLASLTHRWTTERGAARVLHRLGGMAAAVDGVLSPIGRGLAGRGDVAGWEDSRGRLQLAIVEGETLIGPGVDGLMRLPRRAMVRAWSAT